MNKIFITSDLPVSLRDDLRELSFLKDTEIDHPRSLWNCSKDTKDIFNFLILEQYTAIITKNRGLVKRLSKICKCPKVILVSGELRKEDTLRKVFSNCIILKRFFLNRSNVIEIN